MHLDRELFTALFTLGFIVVFGVPRVRRAIWMPRELQFQDVPPNQLTPAQSKFLSSYDARLAELGYHPFTTFRVVNMLGHNLIRIYLSPVDPAKCALTMAAAKNRSLFSSHVEFATKYADGTRLVINNNGITSGMFDDLPGVVIRRYKNITNLAELKRRHDVEAEKLRDRGVVFYTPQNYFQDFSDYHLHYCEHQASRNLLRWDPSANVYRATTWSALRGTLKYFDPFAGRFSPLRFGAGLALGGGLPLLVSCDRIPIVIWIHSHAGLSALQIAEFLPLVTYGIAGMSIGVLFARRSFIWGILLGILPSRLLFGFASGIYSFWMAALADLTARIYNRRANIL